jgi:hypothetical protein
MQPQSVQLTLLHLISKQTSTPTPRHFSTSSTAASVADSSTGQKRSTVLTLHTDTKHSRFHPMPFQFIILIFATERSENLGNAKRRKGELQLTLEFHVTKEDKQAEFLCLCLQVRTSLSMPPHTIPCRHSLYLLAGILNHFPCKTFPGCEGLWRSWRS